MSHAPPHDQTLHADTRQRLLQMAGEVFATQGFRNATVREICRRAQANVAAVNYHFGDKARLYSEVLRFWAGESLRKYPPNLGVTPDSTSQDKLHAFVYSFFLRVFDTGQSSWFGKLMSREMADPTHALAERIEETIRPMAAMLQGIIRELGPDLNDSQVRRCALSVVGQILFYHHCRAAIEKVFVGEVQEDDLLARRARHVTDFTLAGIRELNAHANGGTP